MVDEYMLTEAEVSFIKLLETLDRTAQHHSSAVASHRPVLCHHDSDCAVADLDAMSSVSRKSTDADVSSNSSNSSSVASGSCIAQHSDTHSSACCTQSMPHPQTVQVTASSADEEECHCHDAAQGQSQDQAPGAQDVCQRWEAQLQDANAKSPDSATEPKGSSSRHLPLHSSASSHAPVPAALHSVANARFKGVSAGKGGSSTNENTPGTTGASTGISRQDSGQEWRLAAYNLLYNPRVNPQDGNDAGVDSIKSSAAEPVGDQQEIGMSNMQLLNISAKELQVGLLWGCEWG